MKKSKNQSSIETFFRNSKCSDLSKSKDQKLPPIYEQKLKKHTHNHEKITTGDTEQTTKKLTGTLEDKNEESEKTVEGPYVSSMLEYILKLEGMLVDERNAKKKILNDYNSLKKQYVSNLQRLAKVQTRLLDRGDHGPQTPKNTEGEAEPLDLEQCISEENMKLLNFIQPGKTHDATFVRKLLCMLYEDKASELEHRTLSGRARDSKPITPEKVDIIHNLMSQRIEIHCADPEEKIARSSESNVNKLIATALGNLKRRK